MLLGNGRGGLSIPIKSASGSDPNSIAAGDFNGDGNLDLVTANALTDGLTVLLGKGNGSFESPKLIQISPSPLFVAVADFNGDGKLDIVTVSETNLLVFLGDGRGNFKQPISTGSGANPRGG